MLYDADFIARLLVARPVHEPLGRNIGGSSFRAPWSRCPFACNFRFLSCHSSKSTIYL